MLGHGDGRIEGILDILKNILLMCSPLPRQLPKKYQMRQEDMPFLHFIYPLIKESGRAAAPSPPP